MAQALTAADLAPALADMKRKLMERNVAEQIAQNICDSIARRVRACACRGCVLCCLLGAPMCAAL